MIGMEGEDEYEVPLRDQRYFGAGIKRKRIQFVPSTPDPARTKSLPSPPSTSAAERYLSIVLKKPTQDERPTSAPPAKYPAAKAAINEEEDVVTESAATAYERDGQNPVLCDICDKAISRGDAAASHESSIAHQICLQHSHPPSHIDRTRKGLAVLESHGWDPDSRLGLGAEGKGVLYPIKAKENPVRAGLGARFDVKARRAEKPVELDAGKAQAMEKEGKKKAERLRNAFYRSEEVERYLGQEQVNTVLDLRAFKHAKVRG